MRAAPSRAKPPCDLARRGLFWPEQRTAGPRGAARPRRAVGPTLEKQDELRATLGVPYEAPPRPSPSMDSGVAGGCGLAGWLESGPVA